MRQARHHDQRLHAFVQHTPGSATLRIVRQGNYDQHAEAALQHKLAKRFTDRLTVTIEYVDQLERTPGGKLRLVISTIEQP